MFLLRSVWSSCSDWTTGLARVRNLNNINILELFSKTHCWTLNNIFPSIYLDELVYLLAIYLQQCKGVTETEALP